MSQPSGIQGTSRTHSWVAIGSRALALFIQLRSESRQHWRPVCVRVPLRAAASIDGSAGRHPGRFDSGRLREAAGAMITVVGADGAPYPSSFQDEGRFTIPARCQPAACACLARWVQPVEEAAVVEAGRIITLTFDLPIAAVSERSRWWRAPCRRPPARWRVPRPSTTRKPGCWSRARDSVRHSPALGRHRGTGWRKHRRGPSQPGQRAARRRRDAGSGDQSRAALLPAAIDTSVLPNPCEAEFSRFSSGLIRFRASAPATSGRSGSTTSSRRSG